VVARASSGAIDDLGRKAMVTKRFGIPLGWSALLAVATILCLQPAFGQQHQDENTPAKYQNVTWYTVTDYAFKPGKFDDAVKLAEKYFIPADKASGDETPLVLIHETGPWNVTVIGRMEGGPSDLEWKMSPRGIAWHKAFVKLAGSEAKADEIEKQFGSDIDHTERYIARTPEVTASGE
jgi:hypothetical protein